MAAVKVIIVNHQNAVKIPTGIRLLIRRCCNAVLTEEEFIEPAEVSVNFVDNEEIKTLNSKFRNKDMPTDVLSFPLGENGEWDKNPQNNACLLGDVVISVEKAFEQAEIYGHSLQREIAFLTVHSMLHLLGYDHENGGMELVRMREKEEKVLSKLGLSRGASYVMENDE